MLNYLNISRIDHAATCLPDRKSMTTAAKMETRMTTASWHCLMSRTDLDSDLQQQEWCGPVLRLISCDHHGTEEIIRIVAVDEY